MSNFNLNVSTHLWDLCLQIFVFFIHDKGPKADLGSGQLEPKSPCWAGLARPANRLRLTDSYIDFTLFWHKSVWQLFPL